MLFRTRAHVSSALAALALVSASPAIAVTVNFNGTSGGVQTYFGSNVSYVEQGVTVFVPASTFLFFDSPGFGYGAPSPDGSDHAQVDGGSIVISTTGPFSLLSFQGGTRIAAYQGTTDSIVLTGHQVGTAATLSFTQVIPAGTVWSSIVLPASWTNLTSVEMYGASLGFGAMFLDNIVVAAVPEPSALVLVCGGLIALAVRKKAALVF
jgi:PEP-CTERM motif